MLKPSGMAAPDQKPLVNVNDTLPKDALPSTDSETSMVPIKNKGRLLPATIYRLLLFFTSLTASTPITAVAATNAKTVIG
jgi:hypothetical protein